jgi:hypothetical protein
VYGELFDIASPVTASLSVMSYRHLMSVSMYNLTRYQLQFVTGALQCCFWGAFRYPFVVLLHANADDADDDDTQMRALVPCIMMIAAVVDLTLWGVETYMADIFRRVRLHHVLEEMASTSSESEIESSDDSEDDDDE